MAVALLLASTCAGAAEPGAALSLRAAIERALDTAPAQRIAERSVVLAEAQRRGAGAAFLPQLSAEASQVRQTTNLATFGFSLPDMPALIGPYSVFDARLRLSQRVLDLARSSQIESAGQAVLAARAEARQSRERIAAGVAVAYVDVLTREQAQGAAEADLRLAEELLVLARDQHEAGVASGIDAARAETAVAQDRYALSQARTQLAGAQLQLQRLAVLPMDAPSLLAGNLEAAAEPQEAAESALDTAREHRPELAVLNAALSQANADLAAAHRKRLPTLSLVADYGISGNTPTQNEENTYRYGAVLSLPLYSGGAIAADIDQAALRMEQRRAQLEDLNQQIEQDVRLALAEAINAAEQVRAAAATRDLAQRELDLARDRFANGVTNNVEVVSAQTRLAQARAQYIAALAARQQARINRAAAEGRAEGFDL